MTARGEKEVIRPKDNVNATYDHYVDPEKVIQKIKKMKWSWKDDLINQVKKVDRAVNEANFEKKSNFNDLSSILILPEDHDE